MELKDAKINNQKIYKEEKTLNSNILPGDLCGSPDESFFNDTVIFIDAGFLSKLSRHFGRGKYLIYDLNNLAKNLSRKQKLNCKKIFYYTAPPFQSRKPTKEEERKKEGYDKFIEKLKDKKITIREGRCQRLKIDGNYVFNQKAVDILLAMDLMNVPLRNPEMKRIILISSDSDFVPVIKSLEENGVKTVLYTFYQKKRNAEFSRSNYLIKSVYKYALLNKKDFDEAPLKK